MANHEEVMRETMREYGAACRQAGREEEREAIVERLERLYEDYELEESADQQAHSDTLTALAAAIGEARKGE